MKDRSELTPEDIAMLCGAFPKGATRARLAEFGIPWPPPGGWRKKLKKHYGFTNYRKPETTVRRDYEKACAKLGIEPYENPEPEKF